MDIKELKETYGENYLGAFGDFTIHDIERNINELTSEYHKLFEFVQILEQHVDTKLFKIQSMISILVLREKE